MTFIPGLPDKKALCFLACCRAAHATNSAPATDSATFPMEPTDTLKAEVKQLLVANLMLQATEDQIGDDTPLFGPGSLGLDSVDALQIVVALDKQYGLKLPDPAAAKQALESVSAIATAVYKHQEAQSGSADGGAPS